MPNSSIPANAEGLSKFSRRSILVGGAAATLAVVTNSSIAVAAVENGPAVDIDAEIMRLWFKLDADQKRGVLDLLHDLVLKQGSIEWQGSAFYSAMINRRLTTLWIDRVYSEMERGFVLECRTFWDGYLIAPAEIYSERDLFIVRKLPDQPLKKPKYNKVS